MEQLNSINEFLEIRKTNMIKELKLISYNFNDMELDGKISYPFEESFDEMIFDLEESNYKEVKRIYDLMIRSLEEGLSDENWRNRNI